MKTLIEILHLADRPLMGWRLRLVEDVLKILKTERADHECTTEGLCQECIKINALSLLLLEANKGIRPTAPVYAHHMTTLLQFSQVMEEEQWGGDPDSDCFGDERRIASAWLNPSLPPDSWRD